MQVVLGIAIAFGPLDDVPVPYYPGGAYHFVIANRAAIQIPEALTYSDESSACSRPILILNEIQGIG